MTSEWAAAARLLRRTGFGTTGSAVDAVVHEGRAAYVARMLASDPVADPGARRTPAPTFPFLRPTPRSAGTDARKQRNHAVAMQNAELVAWWLRRMAAVDQPFGEKATFVWHGHFATAATKVRSAQLMLNQNQKLRTLGRGDFRTLAYSMLTDSATIRWLDGEKNSTRGPNENLSREFMEIFTLGHDDGYTEEDVRQGARALTGWRIDVRTGVASLHPRLHDSGTKTLFGKTGDFGAAEFCDAVVAHPGCPRYLATRLWTRYGSDTAPDPALVDRLAAAYGPTRDLKALLSALFTDPAFTAAEGSLLIGPVEWLVGAVRALQVPLDTDASVKGAAGALQALGQLPFEPPSVGGWPSGQVWASTAAADLRFRAASRLAAQARVSMPTGSTTTRLEALAHLLGVETWSARSLAVLKGAGAAPRQLLPVALNTPEYLVH